MDEFIQKVIFHPPSSSIQQLASLKEEGDRITFVESTWEQNISVFVSPPPDSNGNIKKYIIWSHGNRTCVHKMIPFLKMWCKILKMGFIIYDYQGYGMSEGEPSEQNCYDDLESVVNYALTDLKIEKKDLFLVGRSLGTGVVIHYANRFKWKTTIMLISPFRTIDVLFPPHLNITSGQFLSENKIDGLVCPTKIIHGKLDTLIPIYHGKYLYSKLKNKEKKPMWINMADHNNVLSKMKMNDIEKALI
jgi:fermentation-respiration switch protein FrsA (DUF1100 family)